ncbi:MAG: phosphoadenylyl-sulfate reductase [Actinomycetota bacterium]
MSPGLPDLAGAPAEDVLSWALREYGSGIAIVTAFQAEGMVLIDMAHRIRSDVRVITVDTGRLPQETYALIDQVRGRYGITVEVVFPDATQVEAMVARHGVDLFRRDVALRKLCCHVRKVLPLERALGGLGAWITGVRRGQTAERAGAVEVGPDPQRPGIVKVAPLADWTAERVWEYALEHRVPANELYERGFTSIGCAPCTRAIEPGEDERAGRWWWEDGDSKECGIHAATPDERFEAEVASLLHAAR